MGTNIFSILLFAFFAIFIQESHGVFNETGVVTSMLTPMKADGSINYALIPKMVKCCNDFALKILLVVSYTGEGPNLNLAEHKKIAKKFYDAATPYGIKIIVQVGALPLYEAVQLAKYCNDLQVAGIMVLPAITYKGNLTESVNDLRIACNAAPDISCMYEELPFATTPKVSAVEVIIEVLRLRDTNDEAAICNFDGAVLSMDTGLLLRSTVELNDFAVMILGNFNNAICAGFQSGFPLSLSSAGNLFPKLVNEIATACMSGDDEVGCAKQAELDRYLSGINNLDDTTFIAYIPNQKEAFRLIWGYDIGIRIPLVKPSAEITQQLYDCLGSFGLDLKINL